MTKGLDSLKSANDDKHFWCLCPFHNDTNASMVINKNGRWAGYYKCFTCGAYGSPKAFALWAGKNPDKVYFPSTKELKEPVQVDWESILQRGRANISAGMKTFCAMLGISPKTADRFRVGYDMEKMQYLIPMYDPSGNISGIQRRAIDGTKKSMPHSKQGVFIARNYLYSLNRTLFICEGFSDAAITTEMGFQSIGRYNASQRLTEELYRHLIKFKCIVIIEDNNKVGQVGAKKWWNQLSNSIVIAPFKEYVDIRQQALAGGLENTRTYLSNYGNG
ncbi:MAG: CHC2 zinc finger domain-containing protein [Nitrospira sp.]|nr:CHC2 zinc finger domain-containing protein [Nitrospira sp.]